MQRAAAAVRAWRAALLLSLVIQVSAVGCSTPETRQATPAPADHAELPSCDVLPAGPSGGPDPSEGEPVEITLWHAEGQELARVLTEIVGAFDAMHPGVVVTVEPQVSGRDLLPAK